MSGGQRYWNENLQRWEDGTEEAAAPVAPTGGRTWSVPELPAFVRGYSRRLVWSVLGGAAAAGTATALVLTLVVGSGDDSGRRGGEPAAAVSGSTRPGSSTPDTSEPSALRQETADPSADETASPSASATGLPAGYELHEDSEGFTIARPVGWTREAVPPRYGMDVVNYRSPDGARRLQVFQVEDASPDRSFELVLSAQTKADGFRKLSLRNLDDGDYTGSRLEYLVDSIGGEPDIGTWHVVDERFQAADGELYAIVAYGSDADGRDDERELLKTALGRFCPPRTTCGTDAGPG